MNRTSTVLILACYIMLQVLTVVNGCTPALHASDVPVYKGKVSGWLIADIGFSMAGQ